ncbi:L-dopachrome tautomerase-related protein [Aureibacter tunicatorum]|uniref:Sugar lactone lactonase YvrE n=1 Tax=Aureibacter tunicatorum TaxID=866807 RepID=A0AAE3XJF4_9BACT|nr:L-dopachrome tautomerase-related protein [Aureibacter tunicatorum]MDR6237530.1 sugar lactone lactonase YvrE [Aureibacter tunicatorum]BDD02564.1 hypothetical protein AUTU_00470 [Aureibacter tunicatorum]
MKIRPNAFFQAFAFCACFFIVSIVYGQKPVRLAKFKGMQVTGITVSSSGRIFANFPRWRKDVPVSVVEVSPIDGSYSDYPDTDFNRWKIGDKPEDIFMAVQSVIAHENNLYVLDTRNPLFEGVVDAPRIFVFDLRDNQLIKTYKLSEGVFHKDSYINDLRVDNELGKIYMTDSGHAGLVILDMKSGKNFRVLDNHYSTKAEANFLTIDGKKWKNTVHSDGIALDEKKGKLYYHSLTGYSLYAVDTESLAENSPALGEKVELVSKTPAPDGMIFDKKGNLYFADLEHHSIKYLTPRGKIKTLYKGKKVRWADTFSIFEDYLYYTNSRIHEADGDISDMYFSIYKIKLP